MTRVPLLFVDCIGAPDFPKLPYLEFYRSLAG